MPRESRWAKKKPERLYSLLPTATASAGRCEDFFDGSAGARVMRRASWDSDDPAILLSSLRDRNTPGSRYDGIGFRVAWGSPELRRNQAKNCCESECAFILDMKAS